MRYLLGAAYSTRPALDAPTTGGSSLFLANAEGRDVGRPEGDFHFLYPVGVADSGGKLHLLWGEPDSSAAPAAPGAIPSSTSVWHANYTPGVGWSAAERIYLQGEGEAPLHWREDGIGIAFDSLGHLHLLVSRAGLRPMLHLMHGAGGWSVRSLPVGGLSVDLTAGPREWLYATFIARGPPGPGPANDVLVIRSEDGGRTWTPPTVISSLGYDRATRAHVLAGTGRIVHLLWGQNLSGGLFPEVVRHVVSADGGGTWSKPDDLPLPVNALSKWRAVLDACGAVHVVVSSTAPGNGGPGGSLFYARWSGSWSELTPILGTTNLRDISLATRRAGGVVLVGSRARISIDSEPRFQVLASSLLQENVPASAGMIRGARR